MLEYRFGQQELHSDEDGLTSLRGFLYKSPEGTWVLSQEPQLKSCCIGSHSKVKDQIHLYGDFPNVPNGKVVEVSGLFKIAPRYSENGDLIQYYTLHDASIKASEMDNTTFIWMGVVFIGMLFRVLLFRYGRVAFRKT